MLYRGAVIVGLALGVLFCSGCPVLEPTGPITVKLINDTTLDVEPKFFVSATENKPWTLFTAANRVDDFTNRPFPELRANETATLTYECSDVASMGVNAAAMVNDLTLERAVTEDRVFLLVPDDVRCESTVRITYYVQGGVFHVRYEIE